MTGEKVGRTSCSGKRELGYHTHALLVTDYKGVEGRFETLKTYFPTSCAVNSDTGE
jgi:hypothetical protein